MDSLQEIATSPLAVALITAISTLSGFFVNDLINRRRIRRQQLKSSYAELIASARGIRRTHIMLSDYEMTFSSVLDNIRDEDYSNPAELEVQKQTALNYDSRANEYRSLLIEQHEKIDKAYMLIATSERPYLIFALGGTFP
ncbi:MAG TPA: hypothetical protein VD735_03525 [Candidatus Saccharimonadales bacterium]|nr:hypothetical protein [Candidatus Saccharimonadales bacterium]